MEGVDLQDQLRWYYRLDGKKMWRARKWTWSMFMWVVNTAIVQAYLCHVMLVRAKRTVFDMYHRMWFERRRRTRSGSSSLASTTELKDTLKEFESFVKHKRQKAMTHLQFRVELCRGLRQRTMKGKGRNQTVDPSSTTVPNRRVGKRPRPRQVKRGAETVMVRPKHIIVPKLKMHAGPN